MAAVVVVNNRAVAALVGLELLMDLVLQQVLLIRLLLVLVAPVAHQVATAPKVIILFLVQLALKAGVLAQGSQVLATAALAALAAAQDCLFKQLPAVQVIHQRNRRAKATQAAMAMDTLLVRHIGVVAVAALLIVVEMGHLIHRAVQAQPLLLLVH
ncbi:MAG: hypothetical protein EBS91_10855, partial [Betaproteobacteria bacterium]|nr:hypothetical protein [Betaproteobacteria bacterium]